MGALNDTPKLKLFETQGDTTAFEKYKRTIEQYVPCKSMYSKRCIRFSVDGFERYGYRFLDKVLSSFTHSFRYGDIFRATSILEFFQ